jgi:hypothetical protein
MPVKHDVLDRLAEAWIHAVPKACRAGNSGNQRKADRGNAAQHMFP